MQPFDDGLIKAVRSLDQSSAESVPNTLSNLWNLLSNTISSPFHASEELVLRWLLKNMNGSTETAEQFRRYPLTWSIMACIFKRIPLISLAKSLADRRFIPILQQTLEQISKPQNQTSSDVEMVDAETEKSSKKRKRSSEVQFSLESLRISHGCLKSAESLLGALQALLARLDLVEEDASPSVRMGAEHVKSLFCSLTKDSIELLRPILSICDLALQEQDPEPLENQDSWIATFGSLWNFHLQSSGDASDVAMSLYPTGCIILAKMDRSKDLILDPHVKTSWVRDLRRFFMKNMILPARASFLNSKDIAIIQAAVDMTNFMPTASNPVLFSLSVKTPYSTDDASAKKDHQDWTQKVFEVIEEPMRSVDSSKRNLAMQVVLDTALETKASISPSSLRIVCRQYKTESEKMDQSLITRVASLDIDTFLISEEGHALLDDILKQITSLNNTDLQGLAETDPVNFILSLAKGFARGRDLSGFIKKWFEALAECLAKGKQYSSIKGVWSSKEVAEVVSSLLQSSINTRQLITILDWLEGQEHTSATGALLVILDAISQSITEEEFIDAVGVRLYDMISQLKLKSLNDSGRARWWHIVENTVSWSPLDQTSMIWSKVGSDLKKLMKKGDPKDLATLAAFHCSNRFWLANYPGGPHESEAAAITCSFSKRLEISQQDTFTKGLPENLKLSESPRLVDLAVTLARTNTVDELTTTIRSMIQNEGILSNNKYINGLVSRSIEVLAKEQAGKSSWNMDRIISAVHILLDAPSEALARDQREQILPKILYFISNVRKQDSTQSVSLVTILLSLMVKIMKRPTFYENMNFVDLVTVGESLIAAIQDNVNGTTESTVSSMYDILRLFEALASVTFKQMTSSWESRERTYLTEAFATISSWSSQTTGVQIQRLILLSSLTRALESSKVKTQARAVADPATLREHVSILLASSCLSAVRTHKTSNDANWSKTSMETCFDLIGLEHVDVVEPTIVRGRFLASQRDIQSFCDILCSKGLRAGWRMRELHFTCFGDAIEKPLAISLDSVLHTQGVDEFVPPCIRADISDINRYIDTVLGIMDEQTRNDYFAGISQKLQDDPNVTGLLLTIHRLIQAESGTLSSPTLYECS